MKKGFLAIALMAVLAGVYSFVPHTAKNLAASTFNVATDASKITFVGSKKGGYHTGSFSLKGGTVSLNDGKLTGGKFVIDLTSVKTDAEKLDGHLKSPDFFDVGKSGEATYEITGVNYTNANTADVTGNLTIKGNVVPVKFAAAIRNADDKNFFAQAYFSIDRTLLGIVYGAGMISSDVQVSVFLFANK